ncbi:MAG TPA: tubulin/FtsZ family protein [Methanocorpusculum sp.]|nr:tubulin/FtsZ family protein [Methanocorpusculum sp.]
MRALIIGIGGAGCRIVELLNRHDQESAVQSVCSYVFDADGDTLRAKSTIPPECRIKLFPFNLSQNEPLRGTDFEINSLETIFKDAAIDRIDAIFICAGLGGRMAEAVPNIVKQLNDAFTDPVFTLLTLPAHSEGTRISARAAETLEEIRKVCSASILFDNETWIQRLKGEGATKNAGKMRAEGERDITPHNNRTCPVQEAYNDLNEILVHRVELLLKAGEISERGLETAEVVLDAGEILNTLKGTDIVSIGYATERLPSNMFGFLKRFTIEKYMFDEGSERTARIIELAKKAVYEEVSVPCDLTSANKALVLITGPSDELSMKGFHTVRKWIDRSIKGLEMRAGDYPVHSKKNVGVIIVLAGIENVPRIVELNDIRKSYQNEIRKTDRRMDETGQKIKTIVGEHDVFEDKKIRIDGGKHASIGIDVITSDDEIPEQMNFGTQKRSIEGAPASEKITAETCSKKISNGRKITQECHQRRKELDIRINIAKIQKSKDILGTLRIARSQNSKEESNRGRKVFALQRRKENRKTVAFHRKTARK